MLKPNSVGNNKFSEALNNYLNLNKNIDDLLLNFLLSAQEEAPFDLGSNSSKKCCSCSSCRAIASPPNLPQTSLHPLNNDLQATSDNNSESLSIALKAFEQTGSLDTFNSLNPFRRVLSGPHLQWFDQITQNLFNVLKGNVFVTQGAFKLTDEAGKDLEYSDIIASVEDGKQPAPDSIVALMASKYAVDFYNNPNELQAVLNPNNKLEIFIATDNKNSDGTIGLFIPKDEAGSKNSNIIIADGYFAFKELAGESVVNKDGSTSKPAVISHELGHYMDALGGNKASENVDGFPITWTDKQIAMWKQIYGKMLIAHKFNEVKFPKDFEYGFTNAAEGYARFSELFKSDPNLVKQYAPAMYVFFVHEFGFDPAATA